MPLILPAPRALTSVIDIPINKESLSAAIARSPSTSAPLDKAREPSPNASTSTLSPSIAIAETSASRSSGGPSLPLPKTKAKLASQNGPKKFVLDLPKPVRENEYGAEEPAAKRLRTESVNLTIGGASGLRGLLPEPKTAAAQRTGKSDSLSTSAKSLVPHVLGNKGKAAEKASLDQRPDMTATHEPELDFFGLAPTPNDEAPIDFFGLGGSAKSVAQGPGTKKANATSAHEIGKVSFVALPSTPLSSFSNNIKSSSTKISAAPTPSAPDLASNYYATLPLPTRSDPYPGFYQKPDGSWAARRPEEWAIWSTANGWDTDQQNTDGPPKQEAEMPKDFEQFGVDLSIEVRAEQLRRKGGLDTRPSKIPEEDKAKMEEQQANAKVSYVARSRHQLSTLIQDATTNRQELEDRIAQMKSNKRGGGAKYGF